MQTNKCTFFISMFYSILCFFCMFRTSCIYHQEHSLYMQFCMVCFSYIYASSLGGGRMRAFFYLLDFVCITTHCSLKTYCAILVRRSNFRHQASPRVSPRESTQRRKVKLWARNVREVCLNSDFHAFKCHRATTWDRWLYSPPKEGVLRIFSP